MGCAADSRSAHRSFGVEGRERVSVEHISTRAGYFVPFWFYRWIPRRVPGANITRRTSRWAKLFGMPIRGQSTKSILGS